jgi:hypothetical protein
MTTVNMIVLFAALWYEDTLREGCSEGAQRVKTLDPGISLNTLDTQLYNIVTKSGYNKQ